MFKVIKEVSTKGYNKKIKSNHIVKLRSYRMEMLSENTKLISAFEVDKNHPNGNEIHVISEEAEILIFNKESKKFITILFARPAQIKRYYEGTNKKAPIWLLRKASLNSSQKKNK